MSPIRPIKPPFEPWFYPRDGDSSGSDDNDNFEKNRNQNKDGDSDHNSDHNNQNSNDDEENNGFGSGGGFGNGGGGGGGGGGFGFNNGGNGSNDGGGGDGGSVNRNPSSSSSKSIDSNSFTSKITPTNDIPSTASSTPILATTDASTATILPTVTTTIPSSAVVPIPSPPSDNILMTPSPMASNVTQGSHILPLGSIVAIILGILFCITIAGVIFVITRPKFGSLARLWKDSKTPGSYLPSTIKSFEPKQQRNSSNLYRRYNPTPRPFSRTYFDLQAFRFGSPVNALGQNPGMPNIPNNPGVSSHIAPAAKYDDFQTHQIYSTRMPPPSAVIKSNTSRSVSSKASKQHTYSSFSTRIMSMIETFSDLGVGSGRTSLKTYDWKPPRHDPASEGHA